MAKTCVKLLCEDPAFGEYIKCILMDERTFLNNNLAYSFLTCFLHKDLRALVLLLSVHTPPQLEPALGPALQDLLARCRAYLQHRGNLELEAKDRKSKCAVPLCRH